MSVRNPLAQNPLRFFMKRRLSMDFIFQIALKLVYSGMLIFLGTMCFVEMLRVWTDNQIYLVPFTYERDGKAQPEAGLHFANRLSQSLRRAYFTYSGGATPEPPIASTDQVESAPKLRLPVIPEAGLDDVKVEAFGINFGTLLRTLRNSVHQRNEIAGNISHYGNTIDVQASVRGPIAKAVDPSTSTGLSLGWRVQNSDIQDASFDLACGIFRGLAASGSDLFAATTDDDFCQFLKATEKYQEYRRAILRNVAKEKRDQLLAEAKRFIGPIAGTQFAFANKLAGLIYREQRDFEKAVEHLKAYIANLTRSGNTDRPMSALLEELEKGLSAKPLSDTTQVQRVPQRSRQRPLAIGVSMSSRDVTAGSLCCFVKGNDDAVYAITATYIVSREIGASVIQPSVLDGGALPADEIGTVARLVEKPNASAALIRLNSGIGYSNAIPGQSNQRLVGVADAEVGEEVTLIGRTSGVGVAKGRVVATHVDTRIHLELGKVATFQDLIQTSRMSAPGDSGAPVLNSKNELVGFSFAGSGGDKDKNEGYTLIMPIKPIFEAFNVQLAQE